MLNCSEAQRAGGASRRGEQAGRAGSRSGVDWRIIEGAIIQWDSRNEDLKVRSKKYLCYGS